MTLTVFEIKRGFNDSVFIGDSAIFENELYVIIALRIECVLAQSWIGQCVAQKVGSERVSQKYKGLKNVEYVFETGKKYINYPKPIKLGEFLDAKDGVVAQATRIDRVCYRFVDLIVFYDFEIVEEWTQAEINEALQDERRRKFKIVKGSGTNELANDYSQPDLKIIK